MARKTYFALLGALIIATGFCVGFLAQKRLAAKPPPAFAMAVDNLSNGGFETIERHIRASRSVSLCARHITSGQMLVALSDAAKAGSDVRILVGPGSPKEWVSALNEQLNKGATRRTRFEVRTSKSTIYDQYLIIDGERVFFTAAPWGSEAADSKVTASIFLIQSPYAADMVLKRFLAVWVNSQKSE